MKKNFVLYALLTLGGAPAEAQRIGPLSERTTRLLENARRVRVTLEMDRQAYLPGEDCKLRIVVENPTPSVLDVPDPFDPRVALPQLWSRHERNRKLYFSDWGPTNPDAVSRTPHPDPPVVVIPSGHRVEKTLGKDTDPDLQTRGFACGIPTFPGEFRFVFQYVSASLVSFRVVPARVEAQAIISLAGTATWTPPGTGYPGFPNTPRIARREAHVMALGGDGAHWIVIGSATIGRRTPNVVGQDLQEFVARTLGRVVRLARSDNPIVSLSGVADPNDNITISWTDSAGRAGSVRIDRNREIIPPQGR